MTYRLNDWFVTRSRDGQWCCAHRDGTRDRYDSHEAALAEADRRNADDALAAREDLNHSTLIGNP